MGSPCLFTRQRALKMGYFAGCALKNSNNLHTELSRFNTWKTQSFILKAKLHLLTYAVLLRLSCF